MKRYNVGEPRKADAEGRLPDYKRPHVVRPHLRKMSRTGRSRETERDLRGPGLWEGDGARLPVGAGFPSGTGTRPGDRLTC